jgi:tetratricopeptide (TPR) repeat protein
MREFFIRRKIEKYKHRLVKHGDDSLYFQKVAELYLQISQQESAVEYYQKAIEAYYRNDSRLGEDNDFILEVCWKLLEIDPINALTYRILGQEYCGLGEFDEAVKLYKSFAKKLINIAQYEEAIAQYRNVLVLVPEDIEIREEVFSLLWRLRRKEEAVQELKKIADLAEKAENIAKALECYKKAVEIMPAHPDLQTELTRVTQLARNMEKPLRLVVNK